ncbi:ABC transporter permease [Bacillus sp. T33-2]|uniref:ABC transporter permease n=1 Tax=Bacillus sp. T33-2 TaxID=2054168 RepID=UPI000C77B394|nr:ABC transporter permease [Bacillus sp. T33-2]PLR96760.1 ABC transporter permease [Bacillus sp. T33-2]
MSLFNLAKRNIQKNIRQYLLYFYPMVFSIVLYFTFVSLQYNEQIIDEATALDKIEPAFMAASVMLLIFAAIFIWYSNSFFTKRRKKEVALYSLFGMQKQQVAKLLFFENLLIGMFALIAGIAIGALLSKLFAMILVKLMGFSIITTFTISPKAVIQTIIAFIIIIATTSIHNYRLIYRFSLLQLLKAEKQGEKKPKASVFTAALALLLLGSAYAVLLQPTDADIWKDYGFTAVLLSLVAVVIGTYLFINTFIVYGLKKLSQMKSIYFKGINLISLTHLLFRIKGNVFVLSVIALLSTVTLFAIGFTVSLYYNINKIVNKDYPLSIMYTVQSDAMENEMERIIQANGEDQLIFSSRIEYLRTTGDLGSINRWPPDHPIMLIPETEYRKLAKRMGNPAVKIKDQEAISFYDGNLDQSEDLYTGKEVGLSEQDRVKIVSYEDYSLLNQTYFEMPLVIKDDLFNKLKQHGEPQQLQVYSLKNEKTAGETFKAMKIVFTEENADPDETIFTSHYDEYQKGKQTYGILNFISVFLGLVFLLATGSMLHYKQLIEATSDQPRYDVLRKVGMSRKQMRSSIAKQFVLIFVLPLLIAFSHSSVIITALSGVLQMDLYMPFLVSTGMYAAIYFAYYVNTVMKYDKIVNQ